MYIFISFNTASSPRRILCLDDKDEFNEFMYDDSGVLRYILSFVFFRTYISSYTHIFLISHYATICFLRLSQSKKNKKKTEKTRLSFSHVTRIQLVAIFPGLCIDLSSRSLLRLHPLRDMCFIYIYIYTKKA